MCLYVDREKTIAAKIEQGRDGHRPRIGYKLVRRTYAKRRDGKPYARPRWSKDTWKSQFKDALYRLGRATVASCSPDYTFASLQGSSKIEAGAIHCFTSLKAAKRSIEGLVILEVECLDVIAVDGREHWSKYMGHELACRAVVPIRVVS